MGLTRREREMLNARQLAFLEKHVKELVREKYLMEILLQYSQPQVIILEADPKPATLLHGLEYVVTPWTLAPPDSFLSEHVRKLLNDYTGMLFDSGVFGWQVGVTLDKSRLVFVPHKPYWTYEQECLQAVGWSEELEGTWYRSITEEDEDTGASYTREWASPTRRQGVWKARQVAHWVGEEENTPELNYSVWPNGNLGLESKE